VLRHEKFPQDDTCYPSPTFCGPFFSFSLCTVLVRSGVYLFSGVVFVRTQQLGFEGKASKFCFGLLIKISFRQDIDRVVEVLGSAKVCLCVFVSTEHYQVFG
jgi:hypothetical protein